MAFTQSEEDYLRKVVVYAGVSQAVGDLTGKLTVLVTEKNEKVVNANSEFDAKLAGMVENVKAENDATVKALSDGYDAQIKVLQDSLTAKQTELDVATAALKVS